MKKFLATVTAVVLSLAMVALPSVAATAGQPEGVGQETCDKLGYNKPAALDASSGNVDIYDGATLIGNLTWSGASVTYDLEPGWSIDLCIKSGAQTGDGDKINEFFGLTGSGSTPAIEQNISHIGYKATYTPPTPINVAVTGTPTGEVCNADSGVLTLGSILVAITPSGGATVEYRKQGDVTWIPLGANPITGLAGGTYEFQVTAATGYTLTTPSTFTVVVPSDTSEACVDNEDIKVTPDATFVDESCDVESSTLTYGVITVDLSVVGVTYSITQGGNPVAFDAVTGETGPLTAGLTYVVTATANSGYVLSGPYEEQFTPFSKAVDCTTLAGVTPLASQDPGCELPSFFTIGNTLSDPAALTWTANGQTIAEGTHVVSGPTTITLVATANEPAYGIEGDPQTSWTFTFPADETCGDLETLALTGAADTTPTLALTAFLGLLGLAMVRSGIRVNRTRQEA